jgi:hypothetical protein
MNSNFLLVSWLLRYFIALYQMLRQRIIEWNIKEDKCVVADYKPLCYHLPGEAQENAELSIRIFYNRPESESASVTVLSAPANLQSIPVHTSAAGHCHDRDLNSIPLNMSHTLLLS